MTTKIINIMGHAPAYGLFHNEPRPGINWDTPNGQWVGIWGLDWLDLIGTEVLKITNEFEFEVWQPDLRADRIYSHTFSSGLVHRLFPAEQKNRHYGLKKISDLVSQSIYENLINATKKYNVILRIDTPSFQISSDILGLSLNCPIIIQFFGEFRGPLQNLFRVKKNILGKFDDMREHFALKKNLRRANIITYAAELSRGNLHNYYKGEVISLCMGINFDYWKRRTDKLEVKKKLGLVQKNSILLSTSRLNSAKQVDRVINILKKFDNSDFLYIVTGHGENKYEQYLQNLGESLEKAGKLRFIGYVSEKHLIDLYTAADLFIMSSRSEGGPTATIKAAAMETPIFTTDTGQIAELLEKYDAGVVVPANDYKDWEKELAEILNGKKIKVLDRDIAESVFHWPNVAAHYVRLYERLFESYYGNKWQRMGQ